MARQPGSPARRHLLRAGLAAALVAALPAAAAGQTGIVVVSRERILREAVAARRLHDAEAELTERLQAEIDETKAGLAAEEEELARLRGELPEAEFEARISNFDQRLRLARRGAQERAAVLQKGFQDARAAIVAALPPLLERLRVEAGAAVVLSADQVLAMEPAIDLTDRAIALFDAEGPAPAPPEIDLSAPLFEPNGAAAPLPADSAVPAPDEAPPPAR